MHGFLWGAVFSRVVLHEYGSIEQIAFLSGERHCIQMAAHNSSSGELPPILAPPVRFRYRLAVQPDQRAR